MNLNSLEVGSGPPVVILHGLFGQARNWVTVAKGLSADFRAITVDMPNHGASPWTEDASYPAMAGALAAWLEDQDLAGAALVGHSMGGKAAMALALLRPDLVGRLAVIDIAPVPYSHGNVDYVSVLQALPVAELASRADADARLADAVPDAGVRGLLLQNLTRSEDGFEWAINLEALGHGMEAIEGWPDDLWGHAYGGPALFLAGEASDYVDEAGKAAIAELFPAARHARVAGAGHWLHAEKPAETVAALKEFLAKTGEAAAIRRVARRP